MVYVNSFWDYFGRGYSQAYLAELVGVSTQSISNWECDNSMPDISQIVPLAGSLMVSTDFLLGVGMDELVKIYIYTHIRIVVDMMK